MSRDHIPLKTQLAAALLQLARLQIMCRGKPNEAEELYEHAKSMSSDQIISLFQRDHYPIRKIDGGLDEAWNIEWRFIADHRWKTAKIDRPEIAKDRRLIVAQAELRRILTKPCGHRRQRKSRWGSRKIQNRRKR